MKRQIALWIATIFFITGCVEQEILDDIGLEIARGYDRAEDDSIIGTALIYNFQPDKSIQNTTFSTTATTSRDIVNKLQKQSSDPLSEGSIEVFLFSKELAKDGLINYLDAPQRNASIGARLYLVVVDGNAQDLLTGNYGSRGNAIYISNLLKHNTKTQDLPKTNLQLFFHDYYQKGKTGYLPEIKKIDDDHLELNGISLFKSGKLQVVDTIEKEKMFFFKLLVDTFSEGTQKIKIDDDEAIIRSISSKKKMSLTKRKPDHVTINLKIKGVLREHTGRKLTKAELKKIEKLLEEQTSKECEKLIKRFQKQNIDPVGLGLFIKTKTRGFDFKKWYDTEYEDLAVKVKTKVTIVESGVIE